MVQKVYYLERQKQFWEITVDGISTCVRAGKIGCKGRKYGTKEHKDGTTAARVAQRQVNVKIIEGFEDPSFKHGLKRSVSSVRTERRLERQKQEQLHSTTKDAYKLPHKKRQSIRHLSRADTVILEKDSNSASPIKITKPSKEDTVVLKTDGGSIKSNKRKTIKRLNTKAMMKQNESNTCMKYRKPPKKQTTVRRNAKLISEAHRQLKCEGKISVSIKKYNLGKKVESEMPTLSQQKQTPSMEKSIPKLAQQETLPVTSNSDEQHTIADIKVNRKCRSLSKTAMPKTVLIKR